MYCLFFKRSCYELSAWEELRKSGIVCEEREANRSPIDITAGHLSEIEREREAPGRIGLCI